MKTNFFPFSLSSFMGSVALTGLAIGASCVLPPRRQPRQSQQLPQTATKLGNLSNFRSIAVDVNTLVVQGQLESAKKRIKITDCP